MTQTLEADLEPPVENPESLISTANRRKGTQPEMATKRPPLETYVQPHTIPLCNAIKVLGDP